MTRACHGGEIDGKKKIRALARFLSNSMMGFSTSRAFGAIARSESPAHGSREASHERNPCNSQTS